MICDCVEDIPKILQTTILPSSCQIM